MHPPLIPCRLLQKVQELWHAATRPGSLPWLRGRALGVPQGAAAGHSAERPHLVRACDPQKAVDLVKASGNELHVLLIIADGQVSEALDCKRETINAIVEATHVPLSIVVVGVGDGPFDQMETFDDQLPERRFDNLQFVDFQPFQAALAAAPSKEKQAAIEAAFALCALQELPSQFQEIVRLGQLGDGTTSDEPAADAARPPPPSDWWNTIWGSPPVVDNPGPPLAAAAASAAAARARVEAARGTKRQRSSGPNRGGPSGYGGDGMRWMGGN